MPEDPGTDGELRPCCDEVPEERREREREYEVKGNNLFRVGQPG